MITKNQLRERISRIKVGTETTTENFVEEMCEKLFPTIERIWKLKEEKNAIILAHNYVSPYIFHGVADYTGDSYYLAKKAKESNADIIVFAAVRFMAETAKLLNPEKTILDPNFNGGCSLAEGITEEDVIRLKGEYPDHTFVCYINTTAAVKAQCHVCVTSSNANIIIKKIKNDKIFFLPDKLMGMNIINYFEKKGIKKTIDIWNGTCHVHEEYMPNSVDLVRTNNPDVEVLVHPECSPEVVEKADYVGSTSGMLARVRESKKEDFFLLTECGLTGILESEFPEKNFVGTCNLCEYMKSNTIEDVLKVLENPQPGNIIQLDRRVQARASQCVEHMFHLMEL